ncbi:MAG TPA: SseB family protein [Nocardioidaceae bacterium]|nr:SseB family protein [Nocardioidaceae bacterium]
MREIPDPGFAGDEGVADPRLTAALASYAEDPGRRHAATLEVLQHARLLVPVVAVLGERSETGEEKTSDIASVMMRGADGRTALLAFSGQEALQRWDPHARPVPVSVVTAAQAARQQNAAALVLDVAGPVMFVVESEDLGSLAAGDTLVPVSGGHAWVRPAP